MQSLTTLQALAMAVVTVAPTNVGKMPIPDKASQNQAAELVSSIFGKKIEEAKTSDEKRALAKQLIDEAAKSKDDSAARFSLLRVAIDVAPDVSSAFEAVDAIDGWFELDVFHVKQSILSRMSKSARTAAEHKEVGGAAQSLMEVAARFDKYDEALALNELAQVAGRKAQDADFVRLLRERMYQLQKHKATYEEVQQSIAVLERDPTDQDANLLVGRYYCFIKGDWEGGLPMLALSGDKGLNRLALQELMNPDSADKRLSLADGWYQLAEVAAAEQKDDMLRRSHFWYQLSLSALPALTPLNRTKAEVRLAELKRFEPGNAASASATVGSPTQSDDIVRAAYQAVQSQQMDKTAVLGKANGPFDDSGGLLVGLEVATGKFGVGFRYEAVGALTPIYLTPSGIIRGKTHGPAKAMKATLIAKDGYAVGAIKVNADSIPRVKGLQIVFMKINGGKLDPKDYYLSPPYLKVPQETPSVGGDGKPIVGVHGGLLKQELRGLGLFQTK